MGYSLGVDLGTTYTAAGICRDGRAETAPLGNRAASIPSVIFIREDDTILVGEGADRRGASDPSRVAREFKRRVGDTTPILVGGTPYSAEALMAKLLRWVIDQVAEVEGGPTDHVAVTHPANWGAYKKDLLEQAVRIANLDFVTFLTEPEAAAIYYASTERVELGSVVAVYDLGGGTFDATILRKTADDWEILGHPEGIERLGGIDFDEAVFQHVNTAIGDALGQLDPDDPNAISSVARLRQECVDAKEALSTDTDASIPVMLPNVSTEVRITRGELENMVRLRLTDTIDAVRRALRSAGVEPEHVSKVLLVGGSSRMPIVAQLVSAELNRPVAVDAHPKHSIAMGAALAASHASAARSSATDAAGGGAGVAAGAVAGAAAGAAVAAGAAPAEAAPTEVTPSETPTVEAQPVAAAASAPTQPVAAAGVPDPDATAVAEPATEPAAGPPPGAPPPSTAVGEPSARAEGGGGGKRAALIGGIVAAVVIIGAVVAFFALAGNDPAPTTSTDATTSTASDPTATTGPAVADVGPLSTMCDGRSPCVQITGISTVGSDYSVDFDTIGFVSAEPIDSNNHVHFWWNNQQEANVGTNGSPPGEWFAYGGPSPFTEFSVSEKPSDATGICASEAQSDHSVVTGTGTCFPVPGS